MNNQEAAAWLSQLSAGIELGVDMHYAEAIDMAIEALKAQELKNSTDVISRQAAIDALSTPHGILYPIRTVEGLPSVQPERLSDDDYETIRIHLSAAKERLCNQHRWKEAEEYERLIERFMAFALTEPERKTGR